MQRELLLLRHGKSDWGQHLSDYRRPLTARGRKEAARIGQWLVEQGMEPDHIISSPAERARQTAEIAAAAMHFPQDTIQWMESLYMADVQTLVEVIHNAPEQSSTLMLVGHNPAMEELLLFLADEEPELPEDGKLLPTATVAGLFLKGQWKDLGSESCSVIFTQRGKDC